MNEILTPEEVDELRPANEPKLFMRGTITSRLIVTIDALASALKLHMEYADVVHVDNAAKCAAGLSRVAAWLEPQLEEEA